MTLSNLHRYSQDKASHHREPKIHFSLAGITTLSESSFIFAESVQHLLWGFKGASAPLGTPPHPGSALPLVKQTFRVREKWDGNYSGGGIVQGQLRHDLDIELVVDLLISPIFSRRVMSGGSLPDQLPEQLIATVWKAL